MGGVDFSSDGYFFQNAFADPDQRSSYKAD